MTDEARDQTWEDPDCLRSISCVGGLHSGGCPTYLEGRRQRCPVHGIPDCSPLLNGCSWNPDPEGRSRTTPEPSPLYVVRCRSHDLCRERVIGTYRVLRNAQEVCQEHADEYGHEAAIEMTADASDRHLPCIDCDCCEAESCDAMLCMDCPCHAPADASSEVTS